MLTLAEVKSFLRIDFDDDDGMLESLMKVADEYLTGAIGKTYNKEAERAKLLALIVVQDLYDSRGMIEKVSGTVRKLISDFTLQLQLETVVE